jgi:hypothetical protein
VASCKLALRLASGGRVFHEPSPAIRDRAFFCAAVAYIRPMRWRASSSVRLARGGFNDPVRVVGRITCCSPAARCRTTAGAFNRREGWAKDVSREFAEEVQRRADLEVVELPGTVATFVEFYTRPARQLTLRLV